MKLETKKKYEGSDLPEFVIELIDLIYEKHGKNVIAMLKSSGGRVFASINDNYLIFHKWHEELQMRELVEFSLPYLQSGFAFIKISNLFILLQQIEEGKTPSKVVVERATEWQRRNWKEYQKEYW